MSHSNDQKLEELSSKIHVLVVVLIVLAVILTAYMAVECALLFFSFCKKKKTFADPEKIVVKSDKSSKSGKSKKASKLGKSSKSSKKSSKSSSRKQKKSKDSKSITRKQKKPKHSSKVSQSSAKSSVSEKPKKVEKAQPSKKTSGEGKTKAGQVAESLKLAVMKSGKEQSYNWDDTKTEDQIRAIPNQFETPSTAKSMGSIDAASNDTRTEDQIRAIPNQFTPDVRTANLNDSLLSDRALQQVVTAITAQLASNKFGTPSSLATQGTQSRGTSQEITPLSTPESQKQPLNVPQPVSVPPPVNVQQPPASVPAPFAQPAAPSMGRQVDSVYIMEAGQNGEIQKANMPVEPVATNSLMIDAKDAVPINGKPETGKPQGTA